MQESVVKAKVVKRRNILIMKGPIIEKIGKKGDHEKRESVLNLDMNHVSTHMSTIDY